MKNKTNYSIIIPPKIKKDNRLKPNAKLIYGDILFLSIETGFCWASNNYFATQYELTERNVSMLINELKNYDYIDIKIVKDEETKKVLRREIKPLELVEIKQDFKLSEDDEKILEFDWMNS